MFKLKKRQINGNKAASMSIILNSMEIVMLIGMIVADMFYLQDDTIQMTRPFSIVALLVLVVEAVVSVRDGFIWRKTNHQNEMLIEAMDQLDDLNLQLRKQRHDFLNHLQVVYSLVDMKENDEAIKYIETVYGQMHRLSAGMKTDIPAVNALLQAKLAQAEEKGVKLTLDVTTQLSDLPMNDWELCRVLGNLMDNGMDAMDGMPDAEMKVEIFEDLKQYGFRISNNGPEIPESIQAHIFQTGFTTKSAGHGLGLSIVKEIMEDCGGSIYVKSNTETTVFGGAIPKIDPKNAG